MSLPATVTDDTRSKKPSHKFEGHSHVNGVIHLPRGPKIMTCSSDGSLGVWNLQTGKQIAIWRDGDSRVNAIALSSDGKKVVSGSDDSIVRLWNIETGKVIARWTGHTGAVGTVCWNRDGVRVLSGSNTGTAMVWDVETGKTVLKIDTGLTSVYTAIFSPQSTLIATGGNSSEDEFIKIWDSNVDTGKLVASLKGHTWDVQCLAWTANGSMLISGSIDDTIRTWDTSTWQQLRVLTEHSNVVNSITISLDGLVLASASEDNSARLWNLESGQPIGSPLTHPDGVACVSFSTDGKSLATGCRDKNARTWDISPIIKEAGLNGLPDIQKSFLHADATRHPVQQPKNAHQLSPGFFADSPHISTPSHTPTRRTFLQRVRLPFFKRPKRHEESIELVPPSDVPLIYGQPRYYTAAQERARRKREKEKAKQARVEKKLKHPKNPATAGQSHALGDITQHTDQSHVQPSSEPHPAASTSPTTAANPIDAPATTFAILTPNTITLQAGCWTRFLLQIGCISVPHPGGHH